MARDDTCIFTEAQLRVIRKIVADAIIGARVIHPLDATPQTQAAIRRAIES